MDCIGIYMQCYAFWLSAIERIGGDPLKRRITDQVESFIQTKLFHETI